MTLLVRLGKDKDSWAVQTPGIKPMIMNGRKMSGWVKASSEACGNDKLRQKLISAAIEFNRTLPSK